MSLLNTPKGLRLHIGLFGKRNAGKSSLINALTNQTISIVSNVPGTTTDPVEKACEFLPLGPVVFIDTAGVDDVGDLGLARVKRSLSVLEWVDMALIVTTPATFDEEEKRIIERTRALGTPAVLVVNRTDETPDFDRAVWEKTGLPVVFTSARERTGLEELRSVMVRLAQDRIAPDRPLVGDLAGPGDTVILVTPIDTGAPKGRLILPQVQAIRELLDAHAKCFVVQEDRVAEAIADLKHPPKLVMADSQVIKTVNEQTPEGIPLTTFSTQMAYSKSDIVEMARGAAALSLLLSAGRRKRPECRGIAEIEHADAPGAVDLVAGEGCAVDSQRPEAVFHLAKRLHGIREEEYPAPSFLLVFPDGPHELLDRLDGARDVVDSHDGNKLCIGRERCPELLCGDEAPLRPELLRLPSMLPEDGKP